MTTKYLDFEGGNDANDGLTFANRKLTLASAVSGLTAGAHEIRIKASKPATPLGNATWTNDSGTVTLAGAVTANIDDGETAWTAAANVTATASSATYREGTKSANLVIASAFTTGKVAYRATGTLNLSGYQQVSFWVRSSATHASGVFELKLCTDTTGDTPAHTITIPAMTSSNTWYVFTVDLATNLNAAIASVALYAVSDPASVTINLDNVIACKAASADDSLTLTSLVSRNVDANDPWFAIDSINGTTVKLRTTSYQTAAKGSYETKWFGTTGSYSTYKREAIVLTAVQTHSVDGASPDSPFVMSGGWNRTDMSTQDDVSWFRPLVGGHDMFSLGTFTYNVTFSKLYFAGTYSTNSGGLFISQGCESCDISDGAAAGCAVPFRIGALPYASNIRYVTGALYSIYVTDVDSNNQPDGYIRAGKLWGMMGGTNLNGSNGIYYTPTYDGALYLDFDEARNFSTAVKIGGNTAQHVYVRNCVFAGNYFDYAGGFRTIAHMDNCAFGGIVATGKVYFRKYNQTANDHRIQAGDSNSSMIATATDQQYDVNSLSWKFNPKRVAGSGDLLWCSRFPLSMVLAKVACNAGEARTVLVYMRRDNTGLNMRLRVKGRQIAGVPSDVSASPSGGANAWESVQITFTPSEAGIVEVLAEAWGGTTYSGWVNHLEVS